MKITAVVPMKLNSKRLHNKNIKSFTNGKPLCWYILETLLQVEEIDEVYVYCSDRKIVDYIPNGVKYLQRSTELDKDTTSMNEVLSCFADDVPSDIYIMTHTTAPFVKKESISRGLRAVMDGGYDSSFAAKVIQDFLWKDNVPCNYTLDKIPRTQDLDKIYCETSGFYVYRKEIIKNYNRRIGNSPYIVEVGEIEAIDIDENEDFIIADAIYNFLYRNKESEMGNQ